jgi:hypothetical protein
VAGKSLAQWRTWAAGHDQLPQSLCGSFATVSGLQRRSSPVRRIRGHPDPLIALR